MSIFEFFTWPWATVFALLSMTPKLNFRVRGLYLFVSAILFIIQIFCIVARLCGVVK
jgi:hypothetical protein